MSTAIVLSSDLLFATRIVDTGSRMGFSISVAKEEEELWEKSQRTCPSLIIFDLSTAGLKMKETIERLNAILPDGTRLIAVGSHIEKGRRQEAVDAGCHDVLVRSDFAKNLPGLLHTYLG